MNETRRPEERRAYQIRVLGHLGDEWSHWFDGMAIAVEGPEGPTPVTVLSGVVADQSALRGILSALWDLNLTLISVDPIEWSCSQACHSERSAAESKNLSAQGDRCGL